MDRKELGKRLRVIRKQRGLSQSQLANLMGYKDHSTLAKVETGVNDITVETLYRYASALGVNVIDILRDKYNLRSIKLSDLQPSQFYISEKKLSEINKWFNPDDMSNFEPIPIKMLDNDIVITDGHTRAVVALKAGLKKVPVVWDEDDLNWDMYKECVEECKRQDITSPNDLLNRIIPEKEYDTKWNKWCDAMQEKISNK